MDKDRTAICNIISEMLDNPDEHGIYPTSTCFTKLEMYIESQRLEAIGWANADACSALDKGKDPRIMDVSNLIQRAMKDLSK